MMQFDPFRLDTVNQCLWRRKGRGGEERVLLPPKAYAVLLYLIEHAGRLVAQDELLDAVWPGTHIQPEGIKTQILHIRRVLGDDPKHPRFIETLPRRGYRFVAMENAAGIPRPAADNGLATNHIVGRDRSLAQLSAALGNALEGKRQVVFVTGESGIGKTALVDEFQCRAEASGLRIMHGQCVEGYAGKEPYYPMLEALGDLAHGAAGKTIVDILASQAPTWLAQFPALLTQDHRETLQREILGATRERMLREIGEAVETIASDGPLLLVFEDLQWVDQATVDLVSVLARRRAPAKLMLIGTYRPVDLALADHPLKTLKQELILHQQCQEIALPPLSEGDVAEYLATHPAGALQPPGLAEAMHRHSGGNPLFMVAAIEHLVQRGLLSSESGSWQLRLPLNEIVLGVPEGLGQMIEAQIGRLSMEEQRALEAASVVGAVFSVDVAAAAADLDIEEFDDLCDRLSRQDRIVRAVSAQSLTNFLPTPRYEFVHALHREVFYQRQAPGRRARLHHRVGESLERQFPDRLSDAAPELADHFERCADWPRAIKYLSLAADLAARRFAHREAIVLLQQALELAGRLPDSGRATTEKELLVALAAICVASFNDGCFALPTWQVDATAGESIERSADREAANDHRELRRSTILKLADSLPPDEPLRLAFLSAPAIRNLFANAQVG